MPVYIINFTNDLLDKGRIIFASHITAGVKFLPLVAYNSEYE